MKNTENTEYLAYHKTKRKFLTLAEAEKASPDEIEMCEFSGQNFKIVAN
jgi:hypothetical protein